MLAKRMAIGLHPGATVVELGAGTGSLTHGIRAAGVRDADLHLVEQAEDFAGILRQRFPEANVHCIDADSINHNLRHLRGRVDFIVSGLPILWFDRAKKSAILDASFSLLRPEGSFQQLTYLGGPPVKRALRRELQLTATLIGVAPINIPPAFVYRFQKGTRGSRRRIIRSST